MADTSANPGATPGANPQAAQMPQMRVVAQYVRDLSFENPGAPDAFRATEPPKIDVAIEVKTRNAGNDVHEVSIRFRVTATRDNANIFLVELDYAGLFELRNFDDRTRDPVLMIECPRLLFPFARRVLADTTRDGGFPPLMLEPVDFSGIYRQQMAQQAAQQGEGGNPPAGNA